MKQDKENKKYSNVNIYFIPNNKNPNGGRFFNCYINRAENLDLNEILPDRISNDNIQDYIQKNHDESFKLSGGVILRRDETIGNVNVFSPSDGSFRITEQEKDTYDELENLGNQVKDIIKAQNERNKKFQEMQLEILKQQKEDNEELSRLSAKIDELLSKKQNKEKNEKSNEENGRE